MKKYGFTLGECEKGGCHHAFRLRDKKYSIIQFLEEDKEEVLYRSGNMKEAYARWKTIKAEAETKTKK